MQRISVVQFLLVLVVDKKKTFFLIKSVVIRSDLSPFLLQDLRCSLLPQVHSAPGHVLEELKVRLQLKDQLFQEVMSDRTRQAREHEEQVQELLRTISSRDQYLQVEQKSRNKDG